MHPISDHTLHQADNAAPQFKSTLDAGVQVLDKPWCKINAVAHKLKRAQHTAGPPHQLSKYMS
jgi:hypothetical protein